jgi:phage FluMu protein Com
MSDSLITITCVVCQHQWQEDVEKLKAMRQSVIYKAVGTTSDFRIPCPRCGTVNIVTVREEANDDQVRR